jgi:hypothetical protein
MFERRIIGAGEAEIGSALQKSRLRKFVFQQLARPVKARVVDHNDFELDFPTTDINCPQALPQELGRTPVHDDDGKIHSLA